MILQDHVIKKFGDFIQVKYSLYIPTLPKLIALMANNSIDIVLMDI